MILKLLIPLILLLSFLNANDTEDKILEFEEKRFSQNPRIEVNDLSIFMKKELSQKGWYGFIVDIKATMAGNNVNAKDIVFSNGEVISSELFDLETGKSLKDLMTPKLTNKYYDKKRLIAGNHNAKDKIVIFSDPLCPFCMDYVPDVIKYVKKHEDKIALYYYHFPLLALHPAAAPLVKLMVKAKHDGIENIEEKIYSIFWDEKFSSKEKDESVVIDAFNKEFKTLYTEEDINSKNINEEIFEDVSMGENVLVQGTPTVFINGEQDKTKLKYEELGK
ncbi:disulfide bond formation protein DsbA [Arcobacter sp. CECT 8983]|uniref:DsbA family protein n=1 Tax=Arcobacter sp. CECT 8983 TaxID=2044508 RepID=UPI00100AB28A|nr:thioredoxin domain-containing protein [Arcobacter sp. CECT 8983]RXJ91882.1 disulfide bond formation protein DsbA [Arcobacter sp. CECT 8983]